MDLFLGVDGGQSSTTAIIGDATGAVLGTGHGGPCNHARAEEGREKFTRAIRESVSGAAEQAGLDFPGIHFEAACLGLSGGPEDKRAILAGLLDAGKLVVTTDAAVALSGALAGEPGIVVIAGTGSIAYGRNAAEETARAGGWGYAFGDEGGGFDLTRRALRAALKFEEGWGPPTALRRSLMDATAAPSANHLLHLFYTKEFTRPRIAAFAKLVDDAARAGDAVATAILYDAAGELLSLAAAVRQRLFKPEECVRIAYLGGVFRSRILLDRCRALAEAETGTIFQAPVYGPAAGALIEAWRAAGLHPPISGAPQREK